MRLAIFYAAAYLATMVGFASVQLGWRPDFVATWDGRSRVYLDLVCLVLALSAAAGLSALAPKVRFPKLLRALPGTMAILGTAFTMLGLLALSPASSANEIQSKMTWSIGAGIAVGFVTGLIASFETNLRKSEAPAEDPKPNHAILIGLMGVGSAVGFALLLTPRARDDGKFHEYGRFSGAEGDVVLGVASPPLMGDRYGVLKLTDRRGSNSLILESNEWRDFKSLWSKAERAQSGDWRAIGEVHDTEPSDPARVAVSAGTGVRFVVSSPHSPTVTSDLAPSEFRRFDAALASVEHDIDN